MCLNKYSKVFMTIRDCEDRDIVKPVQNSNDKLVFFPHIFLRFLPTAKTTQAPPTACNGYSSTVGLWPLCFWARREPDFSLCKKNSMLAVTILDEFYYKAI